MTNERKRKVLLIAIEASVEATTRIVNLYEQDAITRDEMTCARDLGLDTTELLREVLRSIPGEVTT